MVGWRKITSRRKIINIWLGCTVILISLSILIPMKKRIVFQFTKNKEFSLSSSKNIILTVNRNKWNHPYQQVKDLPFYVHSAVANIDTKGNFYSLVSLTVWDGTKNGLGLVCCFHYPDGTLTNTVVKLRGALPRYAPLIAKVYTCELDRNRPLPDQVKVYPNIEQCEYIQDTFKEIVYPENGAGKFAVCVKTAYGSRDPIRLVEWFEYQQMMGVDKVIVSVQYLDKMSIKTLEYYEKQGYVEIIPYGLPGVLRGFEENNRSFPQFFHDEVISTTDCQDRVHRYSFAALIDFDEFIVPNEDINLKDFVKNSLLHKWDSGAVFTLNVGFFITDWGKSDTRSSLYTVQYTKRDNVRLECYKNIYIPDRVRPASLSNHAVIPKPGYRKLTVPKATAVLHHYRQCPKVRKWNNTCMTRQRYTDTTILRYQSKLEDRVTRTWKAINNL